MIAVPAPGWQGATKTIGRVSYHRGRFLLMVTLHAATVSAFGV